MRIIKKGKLPKERKAILCCDKCKTKFECSVKEMKYRFDQRDGDFYEVNCPFCREKIFVAASLVK